MPRLNGAESRCEKCYLRGDLCICSKVVKLNTRTRILFISHYGELKTTSNSARLACLALNNSKQVKRGELGVRLDDVILNELNSAEAYEPLYLFPSPTAETLDVSQLNEKPKLLIIPDGTWKQAKKIKGREATLAHVKEVQLPMNQIAPLSERLRESPSPHALSTIEAAAHALRILEPNGAEIQRELNTLFKIFVDQVLDSRGRRPVEFDA